MSTNKTTHYTLHSWAPNDEFHLTEINENFAALDAALKAEADTSAEQISALQGSVTQSLTALQTTVAAKADSSAVTALQGSVNTKASAAELNSLKSTVNQKANASDLNALKTTVNAKADSSTVTALQNTVNGKASTAALNAAKAEIPHFLTGSYAGTGSAVTVNLGVAPKVVVISTSYGNWYGTGRYQAYSAMAFSGVPTQNDSLVLNSTGFVVDISSNVNLVAESFTYYYWVWY